MITVAAICFDAFGTLIRYNGRRVNPYRRLLRKGDGQRRERLPFLTRNAGIAVFAEELGLSDRLPLIRRELDAEIAGIEPFPETAPVLSRLRAAGMRLAVCSNVAAEYGTAVRRLLPDLDAHVLSFEVGAAKPDPAIYRAVCEALGRRPGDILFVGDSKRCDLHGPVAFGMQARWLDRKHEQTLVDVLADYL